MDSCRRNARARSRVVGTLKNVLFLLVVSAASVSGQTPIGFWKTIDDNSGKTRSIVEIQEKENRLIGTVRAILDNDPSTICDQCKGEKQDAPIMGMEIIWDMKPVDDRWKSGVILDPESGNEYRCVFWLEEQGQVLRVRGKHWTGLYRTQTWHRTAAP